MSAPVHPTRLRLIGEPFCMHGAGQVLALERTDALMLAYVAIEGPTPRKALATLLWPEVDDDRARANLRQRLFRLRKSLGFDLLDGAVIASLAPHVQVDLASPDAAAGELLGALTESGVGAMAAWLTATRLRRRDQRSATLVATAARLESAGQLTEALAAAHQLLDGDATSEHAHRLVMRLHYLRGDRAAALLAFDRCEQILKHEVGARPSAETLALLQTIEQAQVPAWRSGQTLPASVLRPPRMIGREHEMATALSAWAAGERFVVTGEAGVGKSRLLGALFDARADVLLIRARPGDDSVPLSTLMRLAGALAERWPAVRSSAAHAQLLELASGSDLDPRGTQRSAVPLGAALLRAAQVSGMAGVVLDDLQFADDASVDIWRDWLDGRDRPGLAALSFGFASRVAGAVAQERIAQLRQHTDMVVVAVLPLAAAQTRLLVESLALVGTDVPAVSAALDQRIGGNPLHLLETIRHALEQHGALRADRLDTPVQVLDLLEQRIAALSAEGLLLVRIATVAGSDFSPDLAQAVSGRDVLELADAWSVLERLGIFDVRGFAHDLMLEAAMRLLPQPIRRVIHRRVAEFCKERGAPPARLAQHWLQAGDPIAAMPHLVAAARLAWRAGRGHETRVAFFNAAEIELGRGQPDAAFDLLFECAEATARLSPVAAFDEVIARLVPLERTASQRARITLLQAGSCYLHGDHAGSDRGMADAQLMAIACGDRLVEAECLYDRAWHSSVDGRLRDAVEQLSACASLQRSLGLERLALVTDASKLGILRKLGQVRPVLQEQQRSLQWLVDNGAPVDLATSRVDQLLNQLDLGEAGAADAGAPQAWQAICETDMRGEELSLNARSMLRFHRRRGRWDLALGVSDEAARRLAAQGESDSALASERAALYLDLGRPELAQPYIGVAESEAAHLEHARWSAAALRWRYLCSTGSSGSTIAGVDPMRTLEEVLRSERFPLACELVLVAGQSCPQHLSPPPLAALIKGCEVHGLKAYLLPLRALQAWLLARDGNLDAACVGARATHEAISHADLGAALPASGLWLAKALQYTGQPLDAARVVRQATAWVEQRLVESVPAEFHASFRQRNPVHNELLALAQRLHC